MQSLKKIHAWAQMKVPLYGLNDIVTIVSFVFKCIALHYLRIVYNSNFKEWILFIKFQTIFSAYQSVNQIDPLPTVHNFSFSTKSLMQYDRALFDGRMCIIVS